MVTIELTLVLPVGTRTMQLKSKTKPKTIKLQIWDTVCLILHHLTS